MFRLTVRDLLWLMVVVGLALAMGLALLAEMRVNERLRRENMKLQGPCDVEASIAAEN